MSRNFRQSIRIARTNLDGARKSAYALSGVRGIGIRLANVIVEKAGLDPDTRLGFLSDGEVGKIENIVENPVKHDVPGWLFNRQKDRETGNDVHLIGPDIDLHVKVDLDLMKSTNSWRGYRHSYGLKVRGQKTRTTGRKRKAVGVKKREIIEERARLRS
ncbi:MAG: 30S ribosomal protein S13 [Candidatus Bathyarchaeota archaeon]|nr:30S ribosomal protein S13 [Candidatus Bathyarchaeota archaeon]